MKPLVSLLLGLFVGGFTAFAQSSPALIDSMRKMERQYVKKDSVRVNILVTLADALANTNQDEAMRYANEAEQTALVSKSPIGIATAYRQKGNLYFLRNDYGRAVDYNYRALRATDNLKKNNKGTTLFIATLYNNLGGIQLEMREYDKSIASFLQYLNNVRKLNEPGVWREEAIALLNVGTAYSRKLVNQKAIQFTTEGLTIAEAHNDYQIAAYCLFTRGVAYINLKQTALAVESLKRGLFYANKVGDLKMRSSCTAGLADALFDLERYDESEKYALQALKIAKDFGFLEQQREITQLLVYIYIAQKKSQLAINYLDRSTALRDSLLSDDRKQEIARKEERFAQEKRTAVLNAQHIAELKQQRTERNALAIGTGIVVLAAGVSFWFYKRKRDTDIRLKVEQFNAHIADTELKVLRSQIDPHFIFNALNSISNYVLSNDPFTADRYLTKFATLMRAILNNSDRPEIPLAEDLESLELYIQLEQLRLDHRFEYVFDIDPALDQYRTLIPPLLLQPFVENSIWHGLASKETGGLLTIQIRKDDDMLACTVTDNGIGREKALLVKDARPARKSRGMSITQARIDIISRLQKARGFIKLSDLVEGTEVAVSIPLSIA